MHFEHGVRSGYGVWHETIQFIREYEPWEWAQMGDYDSSGRLIHPNTKTGPRKEVISYWDEKFRGWWRNDDAVHSLKHQKYANWQFDHLNDEKILKDLLDFKAVRMLPQSMIMSSDNLYVRYAYGVWLWSCRKDSESLRTAFRIFEESVDKGIADALQMMSRQSEKGAFLPDSDITEIRGAVIIALEDNKYDTHSFHFKEDLDNVLVAISDLTGGLSTAFRESE